MKEKRYYLKSLFFLATLICAKCALTPAIDSLYVEEIHSNSSLYMKFNSVDKIDGVQDYSYYSNLINNFNQGLAIPEKNNSTRLNKNNLDLTVSIKINPTTPSSSLVSTLLTGITFALFATVRTQKMEVNIELKSGKQIIYSKQYNKTLFYETANGNLRYFFYHDYMPEEEHKKKLFEYYGAVAQKDITYYILSECYGPNPKKMGAAICKEIK